MRLELKLFRSRDANPSTVKSFFAKAKHSLASYVHAIFWREEAPKAPKQMLRQERDNAIEYVDRESIKHFQFSTFFSRRTTRIKINLLVYSVHTILLTGVLMYSMQHERDGSVVHGFSW